MSKKSNKDNENLAAHESNALSETAERTQTKTESTHAASTMFFLPSEENKVHRQKNKELERRLDRLERKVNSNERFARTFAKSVTTQALAADAILYVLRKSLHEDAEIREELTAAIKEYDKHKIRRWFSGFFSILLWIISVAAAAGMGAFIYWAFSGK